jgi:hypothetical protein
MVGAIESGYRIGHPNHVVAVNMHDLKVALYFFGARIEHLRNDIDVVEFDCKRDDIPGMA